MHFLSAKSIEAGHTRYHCLNFWYRDGDTTLSRQSVTGSCRPVTKSISKQDCYARALMIIGHLLRFLILNELNTKNSIASKNWTLNAAAARKKFDGGLIGLSTTSTPRKFDSVSRRNSTAPGSSCVCLFLLIWEHIIRFSVCVLPGYVITELSASEKSGRQWIKRHILTINQLPVDCHLLRRCCIGLVVSGVVGMVGCPCLADHARFFELLYADSAVYRDLGFEIQLIDLSSLCYI